MSVAPLRTPEEGEADRESAEVRHLHPVEDSPAEPVESVEQDAEAPAEAPAEVTAEATAEVTAEATADEAEPDGSRVAALAAWAWLAFTPASGLYTARQPRLEDTVGRARDGDQLPDSRPLRLASQAHGYSHAAFVAVADTAKWIAAHPARLGVLAALVAVALAFPATRHVAGFLLTPFAWAHTALS